VHASRWHATLEPVREPLARGFKTAHGAANWSPRASFQPAIRLGLEQVYGLGEAAGRRIEAARADGCFRSPHELAGRAGLDRESLLHLARAGALASLGLDRRRAVWECMRCLERPQSRPLLEGLEDDDQLDAPSLPSISRQDEVIADYRTAGLSLAAHPIEFERGRLTSQGIVTAAAATAAPEGRRVRVAGIVLTRQRPATAKGTIFLTIEDETGAVNVVVRPDVWERSGHLARRAAVLVVQGRVQRRGPVVHVVATGLETAVPQDGPAASHTPSAIASLPRMSRDFC
jgi:error-prone DNA polymerase